MRSSFTKISMLLMAAAFSSVQANALVYTATSSGNFSSPATWGGTLPAHVPPADIQANSIVVQTGVVVTLDVDLKIKSSFSTVQLQGTGRIVGTGTNYVTITDGQITADLTSLIDADSVYIGSNANMLSNFGGSIMGKKITLAGASMGAGTKVIAKEKMYLAGGVTSMAPSAYIGLGQLAAPKPTLIMRDGTIATMPGAMLETFPFNLRYEAGSTSIGTGFEFPNDSVGDVEIALPAASALSATANLLFKDNMLTITSGVLDLTDDTLVLAGNSTIHCTGGSVNGSAMCGIEIASGAGNVGTLRFGTNAQIVKNFVMNCASGTDTLKLASDMIVEEELSLQNGIINVQGNTLTVRNNSGKTIGGSANSYVLTGANGQLRQEILGDSTVTFHVGHANGYSPAIIKSNNAKHFPEMTVNVAAGVKAAGATGADIAAMEPIVNATWTTSHTGTQTNVDYDITMAWATGMEVNSFDRSQSFGTQYTSGKWEKHMPSAATAMGPMYTSSRKGAQSFGTFTVFDTKTLDITDLNTGRTVQVYPNPATDMLHFTLNNNSNIQATIYNTTGQALSTATLNAAAATINIAQLPAGVYYVQLAGEGINGTAKFTKQ